MPTLKAHLNKRIGLRQRNNTALKRLRPIPATNSTGKRCKLCAP